MGKKTFSPGETVFEEGELITKACRVHKGKLGLEWKWPAWQPVYVYPSMIVGHVESLMELEALFSLIVYEEAEVEFLEADDIMFTNDTNLANEALNSLGTLLENVIIQRFIGINLSPEETMYQAFDTFVKRGDKNMAIDTYSRFLQQYPSSEYVDEMLKVIQGIFMDQNVEADLPDDEKTAYEYLISRIHSVDPQENLVFLKAFEKKFPESEYLVDVMSMQINEYDKLGDEYQLNFFIRKILYNYPRTPQAKEALYYLIHLQRRLGDPEWYENVIRFFLTYDDEEKESMLKKYIERE